MSKTHIVGILLLFTLALGASGIGWIWYTHKPTTNQLSQETTSTKGTIDAPPPLRLPFTNKATGELTKIGTFNETNQQRIKENLSPLKSNSVLDAAAKNKLNDLFTQQYFDHVSPDGKTPADVVENVNYEYIKVGENLALGNFENDAALVQAWMNSPGHRANILNSKYQELGIAVGKGTFEGNQTWIAVQTFAAPLSACATPNPTLQKEYEAKNSQLSQLDKTLSSEKIQLEERQDALAKMADSTKALSQEANAKIEEGNAQMKQGNEIYQETSDRNQASPYWTKAEELQKAGQDLVEKVSEKQAAYSKEYAKVETIRQEYNSKVDQLKSLQKEVESLASRLNEQISQFNQCIK